MRLVETARAGVLLDEGRAAIAAAEARLEELRRRAERMRGEERRAWENALDHARGVLNRAKARLEATRLSGEGMADLTGDRARVALAELADAMARLVRGVSLAA